LETGLKTLEPGESWALMPRRVDDNPHLWSPGIKWNVRPGSFTHLTELFGPVLSVMSFRSLDEAIALVNQTGYGLTSGLESLDDREQERWIEGIRAGNLYINRPTTGAIVLRQPFGGMGKSAFGPGIKVGGPNYLAQLMTFETVDATAKPPSSAIRDSRWEDLLKALRNDPRLNAASESLDWPRLRQAMASYEFHWECEFSRSHDHFRLTGQDNLRRYLPVSHGRVRLHPRDTVFEILARTAAALVAGCRLAVSHPPGAHEHLVDALEAATASWGGVIEMVEENDDELVEIIRHHGTDRVRYAARDRVPGKVWAAAAETGLHLAASPVLAEGRVELLWYLEEQSISRNYHRYGNLGARAGEKRAEPM
jgi:RHH-type proline utilization regulon transcriptional repressor/proline dehydrogenase/delta 1-pyrroline-5-carboxylate dehydrogenase